MEIIKYDGLLPVDEAIKADEPLLAVISFDGRKAIVSHIDEAVEHHILLRKAGYKGTEIDEFFRIAVDRAEGASWTFICPANYKNISDKTRRIAAFYKDGFSVISMFLSELGYLVDISIPKRYRRHIDELRE
ncbi:MAG: hypothetical protein FWE60_03495 [Oscillospiraceae bacterium]|jgi:hypothetical protein|nr:hypothetical protein [Oscillospiraceae bacterium]